MIIGTAGHIDHGKSALVTALTGRSVDRLSEEQRRGITIELNFAPLRLPGLPPVGIIDVPGHEDLIRTMVAGATGVDLVLLVMDLSEGPRAQTEEHLAILEQLRIPRGIPVFTKADLVDDEWTDLVIADSAARLERSAVAFGAPAIVSATTGQGIQELRERLAAEVRDRMAVAVEAGQETALRIETAVRRTGATFRMPVDRTFSVAGVGTVVTGTTWSGSVQVGDTVVIALTGREVRIRSLEAYGEAIARTAPGVRTALGLVGISRDEISRGDVLVKGRWQPTTALDAEVELLAAAPRDLVHRSRVRVHQGTSEVLARVATPDPVGPGGRGVIRLVLERPMIVRGGDRFVLRSYSPVHTIGGGRVLDPFPPARSRADPALAVDDRLSLLVARRSDGVAVEQLPQLTGLDPAPDDRTLADAKLVRIASRVVHRSLLARVRAELIGAIEAHHAASPADAGISVETLRQRVGRPTEITDQVIDSLVRAGQAHLRSGVVSDPAFRPSQAGGESAVTAIVTHLDRLGLEVPTAAEIEHALDLRPIGATLRRALDQGLILAVDRERYGSATTLRGFAEALVEIGGSGDITPARVRERFGLSRKFLIPLLEWADRQGVTKRVGEVRVLVQSGR